MSFIGKNIRKIRSVKKLSQSAFAELFGLKRTSIGAYEEGRAEPKTDILIEIAKYFSISIDLLLTKELTINDLYNFDIFKEALTDKNISHNSPKNILSHSSAYMALIRQDAKMEYILKRKELDYVASLPTIHLPLKVNITTRAFEQSGDAMFYRGAGISHGDILISTSSSPKAWKKLKEKGLYIFVLKNDIILRRIKSIKKDTINAEADNPNFADQRIDKGEIEEIWKVISYYSSNLKNPIGNLERIEILESQMNTLLKRVEDLEQST